MKRISDFLIHRKGICTVLLLFAISVLFMEGCTPSAENRYESDSVWSLPPFKKEQAVLSLADTSTFLCPIRQQRIKWLEKNIHVTSVIVRNNLVYLFYSAQDDQAISRIGLAISGDGIHFSKLNQPILFPTEDFMKPYEQEGGVGDARLIENESGTFLLTYTAFDGKISRLAVASSSDLLNWTKQGPAFSKDYFKMSTSSGSVVVRQEGNRIIAQKLKDTYWMYFDNDSLFAATSKNLLQWVPVTDSTKEKINKPIAGSRFESGPFALHTPQGIRLPYRHDGVTSQLLLDPEDPTKVIDRLEGQILIDGSPEARTLDGLVAFKGSWFLYYPIGDSQIGIAISSPINPSTPAAIQ